MKRILITSIISVCTTIVSGQTIDTNSLSEYDQNKPIGFAASVTGGEGGTPAGINAISIKGSELNPNMPRYNIKGQQVDSNYKGLVIQGGRKYLQK